MKLWLILYVGTQVGGTWGPLPYDMDECLSRKAERQQEIDRWVSTKTTNDGRSIPDPVIVTLKQWKLECVAMNTRPELGSERE